jgi:small GTP-binding protein
MVVSVTKSFHCTVVGDGLVGKSCLVERFLGGDFTNEYVATLQDDYTTKCNLNGDNLNMNITDIAGEVSSYFYKCNGKKPICFLMKIVPNFSCIQKNLFVSFL